jgi:hypothetical protein
MRGVVRAGAAALILALLIAFFQPAVARVPITLKGSPSSMLRQNDLAKTEGYTFLKTAADVEALIEKGELVILPGNADYEVTRGVSWPYAHPEVRLFIERLAEQYREATGEKLVVTSVTRPVSDQPRNAHKLSVHPAGIAVDLRISQKASSRQWLESVLLSLERQGLLDVTRERYPPHYHVAIFPEPYRKHVEGLIGAEAVATALLWMDSAKKPKQAPATNVATPQQAVALITRAEQDKVEWTPLLVIPVAFGLAAGFHVLARKGRRRFKR